MITKTLSLKILRPYYGAEIEHYIRAAKDKNKSDGGKGQLGHEFYDELYTAHPEIMPKRELVALLAFFQDKMAIAYNRGISKLYIEKIYNQNTGSIDKLLSDIVYHEAYRELHDSSMALGLRLKVKSNFNGQKFKELYCGKISLPTAKRQTFPIPMYKNSNKDVYKAFTIAELDGEFILTFAVPKYTYVMKKNKKTGKSYYDFTFEDTIKKKEIKLIISTKRRKKNNGWLRDAGTDSEIRRIMNGQLKQEWKDYSINNYMDDWVRRESKYKKLEIPAIQESLRNKYKIGWLEINRGKKIGEKTDWFVNIVATFPPKRSELSMDIIGGIDIGMAKPIVCAVSNSLNRLSISSNEVIAYNIKALSRRRSFMKRNKLTRVGHGSKNKLRISMLAAKKDELRRKKIIEKWAVDVTAFFVKNKVGLVQREDLKSLKDRRDSEGDTDFFKFQRMHWAYARVQDQIDKKLSEAGISIKVIKPEYTSQICHSCGTHNKAFTFNNRSAHKFPSFKCPSCGVTCDADYNAAKNISNPDIESIIASCSG
jgi:IS605 OrfB family transposase